MSSPHMSIKNILLSTLALLQICTASPVPVPLAAELAADCLPTKPTTAAPTIPSSSLPTSNLTFQYAVIGRGVQNYTCTGAGATPLAIGAIATLWDATTIARQSVATLNKIPGLAVNTPPTAAGYSLPFPYKNLPVIGKHYFLADGTPTFDLKAKNKIIFAKKVIGVDAPANAPKGPAGTGAVQWLYLNAKPGFPSVGLGEVYRVETAGGNPTACKNAGLISVQYATEYWFYN